LPGAQYIKLTLKWTPYAGYQMLYSNLASLGTLLNLSTEAFVAQLLILSILLYVWPYLLFGGLILRSTFLTRKLGGLLLAIVIGAVIIFPTVFSIEYTTLGRGIPTIPSLFGGTVNSTYGYNTLTAIPQGTNSIFPEYTGAYTDYQVNFFVLPNLQQALQEYGCWPAIHVIRPSPATFNVGLAGAESADMLTLLVPGVNIVSGIAQIIAATFGSSSPQLLLPASCTPIGAISSFNALVNAYGIIGVSSYFIPIINLVITLTSIIGLSKLLGGDTKLEGLSRFV
jgi:hypothetical protein